MNVLLKRLLIKLVKDNIGSLTETVSDQARLNYVVRYTDGKEEFIQTFKNSTEAEVRKKLKKFKILKISKRF